MKSCQHLVKCSNIIRQLDYSYRNIPTIPTGILCEPLKYIRCKALTLSFSAVYMLLFSVSEGNCVAVPSSPASWLPPLCLSELCHCFNIDVKHPRIFKGPEDAQFGFSVLQHETNGEKSYVSELHLHDNNDGDDGDKMLTVVLCFRMLVGAPWDGTPGNRKGDVYKCIVGEEKNSACSKVNLGG